MRLRLFFSCFVTAAPFFSIAQSKADAKCIARLRADIGYLASDSLEGRRTGTRGEEKAAAYIEKRYQQMHVSPYHATYYHPFHFTYGKQIDAANRIRINGTMVAAEEGFPLPFSAAKKVSGEIFPDIMEQDGVWMQPLYANKEEADNPHFDWEKYAFDHAREEAKKGATGIIYFDPYDSKYPPSFNRHSDFENLDIPVVFLSHKAYKHLVTDHAVTGNDNIKYNLDIHISKTERSGYNLAAYIDNGAPYTVVLGAHYDHLGYGEDHNSLHANAEKDHLIHNGADDNASGTAALLEMARWIGSSRKLKHYNYLFVNFSGEELGLFGSKAFVKEEKLDSMKIACMINMDMVGRLNDSTHALTLGGIGTSPAWAHVVDMAGGNFKLAIDSAGVGPSDHTSFYNAGIPVLFFFTGTHKDYHKPTDDAELINYGGEVAVLNYVKNTVSWIDKQPKPAYRVTKQASVGKTRFKVSLGIMPDYTFDAGGVKADGVTEGRPASKAGLQPGDVIIGLGEHKINGMQTYMEALGKFAPGDKTTVTFLRNGKEMSAPIELNK